MTTNTLHRHAIDLDEPLTVREASDLYGISAGPLHREHSAGNIEKRGTKDRHVQLDHRYILTCFERGIIKLPRAGGANGTPVESRDRWRATIAEGIRMLQAERLTQPTMTSPEAAAVLGCHPTSVSGMLTKRGVHAAKKPERRGDPWIWFEADVRRIAETLPARENGNGATPAAPPAPLSVTITSDHLNAPRPVMPAATPTTPEPDSLLLLELAHLTGMVRMVADPGQRDALLAQLERVTSAATGATA